LSLNPEEIIDSLNLDNIKDRKWTIMACSALTNFGLIEGIKWLSDTMLSR